MQYISTRGAAPALSFKDVVLAGLASDGGLYVPESFPALPAVTAADYAAFVTQTTAPFVGNEIPLFGVLATDAYKSFGPVLRQLDDKLYLLELFHGPTLAFKDFALQLLGRLFGAVTDKPLLVLGATSGDTGSAAMEGCRHARNAQIHILYPHGRPSDVQRRQMTTLNEPNVHALAVEGSFDDCQDMVKAVFNDPAMRAQYNLVAVNSINWARIMAQVAYYAWACAQLRGQAVQFVVPTGNFGNVYAGYVASRMGASVAGLHIATNSNDSVHRIFTTRRMDKGNVAKTLSPSMDIQVPSNFERYLFECMGRDGAALQGLMQQFKDTGDVALPDLGRTFTTSRHDDANTLSTIHDVHQKYGVLIDPHTAVAVAAAMKMHNKTDAPVVALACAHPAKFPDAGFQATGQKPPLPDFLSDLFSREELFTVIPASVDVLKEKLAG